MDVLAPVKAVKRTAQEARDWAAAERIARRSAVLPVSPPSDIFKKSALMPDRMRLRWVHANLSADDIDNWLEVAGTSSKGRPKRQYPESVIYGISKTEVDNYQDEYGGAHAVAYTIGQEVMLGMAPKDDQEIFTTSPDLRMYVAAQQIGKRATSLSAGLVLPGGEFWTPCAPVEFRGRPPIILAQQPIVRLL